MYDMSFYIKENAAAAINADLNMTEEQLNKALYVKKELSAAAKKADSNICGLEYEVFNREEYVRIEYANGHFARVCVTADSLPALSCDVFRYIANH
jgi:hypothetical protein